MAGKFIHIDKKTSPPKVETLSCPKCGGTLTLRAKGYTKTLVCQFCQSILEISSSELSVLGIIKTNALVEPLIPLGTRGKLHGALWEVIGFMQRKGTFPLYLHRQNRQQKASASTGVLSTLLSMVLDNEDASEDYTAPPPPFVWQEYLLFNPYKGFRWLSECRGHWNYILTLHDIPQGYPSQTLHYLDVNYHYYESYEAKVLFVAGEFYWQVKVGDTSTISDYLYKPGILSLESSIDTPSTNTTKSPTLHMGGSVTAPEIYPSGATENTANEKNNEQIWSLAEYLEPQEVAQAFNLTHPLPNKIGVAFNQPLPDKQTYSAILKTSGLGLIGLFIFYIGLVTFIEPKTILNANFMVPQNQGYLENSMDYISPPFTIDKHTGVLLLTLQAPVEQSWMEVEASLINDTTGESIEIQKGLEFYSGHDYDGYWIEGKRKDEMSLTTPKEGQYHLSFKVTTNHPYPLAVNLQLIENVNSFNNFLFSLFLIATPAILICLHILLFELRREK